MLSRRTLIAALILAPSGAALAQSPPAGQTFTPAAFAAAQAAGKPIVIDISAPWCPTCRAQAPIVRSLAARPEMREVVLLKVDFDSQKDVLRSLRVTQQSTLIAFRGSTETARSVGDTTAAGLERLFKSAL